MSDLRPQTRAKLVGGLVDNPLFYKHDELLAEALVTGMDHHELRIFFDQLYKDGKVERFLDAGSGAQTALRVGDARPWLSFHLRQQSRQRGGRKTRLECK